MNLVTVDLAQLETTSPKAEVSDIYKPVEGVVVTRREAKQAMYGFLYGQKLTAEQQFVALQEMGRLYARANESKSKRG